MPILCCQPKTQQIFQPQFEENDRQTDLNIEPCLLHGNQVQFICNSKQCERNNNTLLCHQCLKQHRNHDWKTKEQYFTKSFKSIVNKNLNTNIKDALNDMQQSFSKQMQNSVIDVFHFSLTQVNHIFETSIQQFEMEYQQKIEKKRTQKNIKLDNFLEMKELYQEQKGQIKKVQQISQILVHSLKHLGTSIKKLIQIIKIQVNSNTWQNHQTMTKFQSQIEAFYTINTISQIVQNQKNYYYFTPMLKHDNIRLQGTNTAIYHSSMPSKPVAIAMNSLVVNHNKFGFEIVKMDSKAFFFQCTTIFIGICNEQIVKIAGMRKINEISKGAYLISSAGWSYHHKDDNYNRNDNVGWTFGEGDKIQVEVTFDKLVESAQSKIIFTKKGRFFDNIFEMPLRLKNEELRKLKPCVSFDAEIGAIVKLYDIK